MIRLSLLLCLLYGCAWALESDPSIVSLPDKKPEIWKVYGVRRAEALDSKRIRLTIGHASNQSALEGKSSYRIVSEDDPYYAYKNFVKPLKAVQLNKKKEKELSVHENVKGGIQTFNCYLVELQLPKKMEEGKTYSVVCIGGEQTMVSSACTAATLTYHEGKFVKPLEVKTDLKALTVMGLRGATHVGNGIICLEFGGTYSIEDGNYLKNYEITLNGKPVKIINFGRRSKIDAYVPVGWPFAAIVMHEIFLQLERPLEEGEKVGIRVSPKVCAGANETAFTFSSRRSYTDSIKVNQVGYLANMPLKRAYLGRWLGSFPDKNAVGIDEERKGVNTSAEDFFNVALGKRVTDKTSAMAPYALSFEKPPVFYLIDTKTGEEAYRGQSVLGHNGLKGDGGVNHSAENVYYLDFNNFNKPGRYYISVEGVGRSLAFNVGDDVYQPAFQMASYGVLLQRCGIELGPPYTPWRRIACHSKGIIETTQDRINSKGFINSQNQVMIKNPKEPDPNRAKMLQDPSLLAYFPFEGNCANAVEGGMELTACGDSKYVVDGDVTGKETDKVYMTSGKDNNGFTGQLSYKEDDGLTFSFWYKKDDSSSGGKIGGTILSLTTPQKKGLELNCSWGIPYLLMNRSRIGYKRVGDKVWRHWGIVVKPIGPQDERGQREWEMSLYINGELVESTKNKGGGLGNEFLFAALSDEGAPNGFFDELRIYNRAMSTKDMALLAGRHQARIPKRIMASGGHHDAGDYNPRSHIDVAQTLMDAYELAPQKFWDGQLNIPEKGNGIPDIVDEALWALKLWIGLQDKDGGVFNGTESDGDPNFVQTVELDPKGDFAWAKDCKGSFLFAGAMAQASRILSELGHEDMAKNYLARAERAYVWGTEHKPDTKNLEAYGEYTVSLRAYAAAQLYHTTDNRVYHDEFIQFTPWAKEPKAKMITDNHSYDLSLAAYAYAMIPDEKTIFKLKESVIKAIEGEADMYVSGSNRMAYKFIRHPYAPITWGTGAYEHFLVPVWHAWGVTRDQKKHKEYFEWMIRTADNTLGANPMNISWIVGLGEKTVRAPLHNSRYNPSGMCMPGQQVQGPNNRGQGYNYTSTVYPPNDKGFAVMHTFVDCHWAIAMDEGLVRTQAETMAAFGLLLKDR